MPSTFVPVSGFYGREEELGWLRGLWDQATGGGPNQPPGGPRMAVILAESGLGKSRLVQALYQQLTTDSQWDPPEVNYWPDAFDSLHNQLRVNPDLKDHEPQGPPRFLWLGMRWQPPGERNLEERNCALPEARQALQSHVDSAKARMGSWKSFLSRSGWSIARKVGEELLDSAMDELIPFKNLVMKGVETAREMARDRQMSGLTAHDRAEKQVADAAEELQNQLREVLSGRGALPTVLWLDDAQWADAMTLQFLRGLWYEASQKKWPLLVVITYWEREWLELAGRLDREENALPRYRDMPGFASLVLKPIPDQPLQEYLGGHLPGLTASQRKLLLEKAGGNFLSMVENVGFLLKTKGNFEQKDPTRPLSPAGEKTVTRWESDRAKRVEQRFHDLEEEIRRLLGWSSRMGIRFLQEVVDELARRQGEDLDAGRLLGTCIDPLAILAEVNPHLREFRDRAFHQVARQYFADMDSGLEEDLNEVLRERLGIWIDGAFDGKGGVVADSPLSNLGSSERRDLLGMAMSLYPLEGDPATVEYQRGLRACLLTVQADASENLWDRVRQTAKALGEVGWAALPRECAGVCWLEDLREQLSTAGSIQTALAIAKRVVEWNHEEFRKNSEGIRSVGLIQALKNLGYLQNTLGCLKEARACFEEMLQIARELRGQLGTPQSLRDVSVSLERLGGIEVAEGNLSAARAFFEEGLQIRRELRGQLGTPESLRDVSLSLGRLGDIEKAGGNLSAARAFFEEDLQIARELRGQLGTPGSLRDVVVSLYILTTVTQGGEQILFAQEGLETARQLAQEYPEFPGQLLEAMTKHCTKMGINQKPGNSVKSFLDSPNRLSATLNKHLDSVPENSRPTTSRAMEALLTSLGLAANGWRQKDLAVLLPKLGGGEWEPETFQWLCKTLSLHISLRDMGPTKVWTASDQEIRRIAEALPESIRTECHQVMADHAGGLPWEDPIRNREWLHHLSHCGETKPLAETLDNPGDKNLGGLRPGLSRVLLEGVTQQLEWAVDLVRHGDPSVAVVEKRVDFLLDALEEHRTELLDKEGLHTLAEDLLEIVSPPGDIASLPQETLIRIVRLQLLRGWFLDRVNRQAEGILALHSAEKISAEGILKHQESIDIIRLRMHSLIGLGNLHGDLRIERKSNSYFLKAGELLEKLPDALRSNQEFVRLGILLDQQIRGAFKGWGYSRILEEKAALEPVQKISTPSLTTAPQQNHSTRILIGVLAFLGFAVIVWLLLRR